MAGAEQGTRTGFPPREIRLPLFTQAERESTLRDAKSFVARVREVSHGAGISSEDFHEWYPQAADFARPHFLAENIHKEHNQLHVGRVLAEMMFLQPYVEAVYADNLKRANREKLLDNAVRAAAAGHDLLRVGDVWGSVPDKWLAVHGKKMAEEVSSGKRFPDLSPEERVVTVGAIEYHDVDPRQPKDRLPEDELLAIVDRAELWRLIRGRGPIAHIIGEWPRHLLGRRENTFEKRMGEYTSYYFPGLMQEIQPLVKAMLMLSTEGVKKGLSQEKAVVFAAEELGMVLPTVQNNNQDVPPTTHAA